MFHVKHILIIITVKLRDLGAKKVNDGRLVSRMGIGLSESKLKKESKPSAPPCFVSIYLIYKKSNSFFHSMYIVLLLKISYTLIAVVFFSYLII